MSTLHNQRALRHVTCCSVRPAWWQAAMRDPALAPATGVNGVIILSEVSFPTTPM